MDKGETIRRFIQDELVFGNDASVGRDTPLCDGVIDSIGLVELVAFIEDRFGVRIDEADLTADNFRTVASIERLVATRVTAT